LAVSSARSGALQSGQARISSSFASSFMAPA
jgi:hypothetical protein